MTASSLVEKSKWRGRVLAGAVVHGLGGYRSLLPVFDPNPIGIRRRLQAYLSHYYGVRKSVEVNLRIPELGVTFRCDLKDHMLEPWVQNRASIYERIEIDHVRRLARPGDRILDLGANHGFWGFSVALAAGDGAQLLLVEANPAIAGRLRRTRRLNPGIDATVVECALGDGSVKEVSFFLPQTGLSGLGSVVLHDYAREHGYLEVGRKVVVKSLPLDAIVEEMALTRIDLVKIDVEQAEDVVLDGGKRSFLRFLPRLVMCETSTVSRIYSFFVGLGYRPYVLDAAGTPSAVSSSNFWGNVFFARESEGEGQRDGVGEASQRQEPS